MADTDFFVQMEAKGFLLVVQYYPKDRMLKYCFITFTQRQKNVTYCCAVVTILFT